MTVQDAIEAFAKAIAISRSFTHPALAEQEAGVWRLSDAPGNPNPRTIEWIAYKTDPQEAVQRARNHGGHWALSAIADPGEEKPLANAYKALGMRLRTTEPLFYALTNDPPPPTFPCVRVKTWDEAETIRKSTRYRQILPEHLPENDSACRLYAAFEGGVAVGWVKSIRTGPTTAWVQNLGVLEAHRRRGIGASLMSVMLADDAKFGITHSVLLASHRGALLYPRLGYQRIGTLLLMSPKR
jgi:GNAT superfamily N-acetyltransferase